MLRPIFIKRTENNIMYDGRANNDTLTLDVDRCYNSDRVWGGVLDRLLPCAAQKDCPLNTPNSLGISPPPPPVESVFDFFSSFLISAVTCFRAKHRFNVSDTPPNNDRTALCSAIIVANATGKCLDESEGGGR